MCDDGAMKHNEIRLLMTGLLSWRVNWRYCNTVEGFQGMRRLVGETAIPPHNVGDFGMIMGQVWSLLLLNEYNTNACHFLLVMESPIYDDPVKSPGLEGF